MRIGRDDSSGFRDMKTGYRDRESINKGNNETPESGECEKNLPEGDKTGAGKSKFCIDNRIIIALYLIFLVSLFLFQNYCYIKWDGASVFADLQISRSYKYFHVISQRTHVGQINMPYPPLVYLVSTIYYLIYGFSSVTARLSLSIFSIIFILSMFGIGKEMGGRIGGICTSALAASSPPIINFAHRYYLDFPQTAMTALAFYLLLLTKGYKERKYCRLLAAALGLAILTKWSTLFFLFIPLIWFIIPHIFKSIKSAGIFIATCGFVGFLLWRISDFYSFIQNMDREKVLKMSQGAYFINIIIPIVIFLIITFILEILLRKRDEKFEKSGVINILNFSRVTVLPFIIIGPWLYWSANSISNKIRGDIVWHRDPQATLKYLVYSLKVQYNYAPLLMLVGLIFIFVFRKDIYKKLVLPVSLIFSFVLMNRIGYPFMRYILSFVIFSAALGGYWVGWTKKFRKPIALALVFISIISLMGWFTAPNLDNFFEFIHFGQPMRIFENRVMTHKLLRTGKPEPMIFDIAPIVKELNSGKMIGEEKPAYLLIRIDLPSTHYPATGEDFWVEAISQNKFINFVEFARTDDLYHRLGEGMYNRGDTLYIEDVILILKNNEPTGEIFSRIRANYEGKDHSIKIWDRPGNLRIYLLKFKNKDNK